MDKKQEISEWKRYGPHTSYPWCSIPDAIEITAEHFYNFALEEVKNEILAYIETQSGGFKELLQFIDAKLNDTEVNVL